MDPNQKLTGIASMGPPMGGGQPPMGGPPMGGPPMGGGQPPMSPPPMGGGTGGGQPPMDPMMGEMAMQGQQMEEPAADPQQDAMMLAEAVVDKTRGDVEKAVQLLDTTKAMLMSAASGGQGGGQPPMDPMMANMGGPLMYKNMGGPMYKKPMYKNMGGPLYREDGGTMSDTDMLRQMIMDSLSQMQGQSGRTMSDTDMSGRTMSKKDAMADLMNFRMD